MEKLYHYFRLSNSIKEAVVIFNSLQMKPNKKIMTYNFLTRSRTLFV